MRFDFLGRPIFIQFVPGAAAFDAPLGVGYLGGLVRLHEDLDNLVPLIYLHDGGLAPKMLSHVVLSFESSLPEHNTGS